MRGNNYTKEDFYKNCNHKQIRKDYICLEDINYNFICPGSKNYNSLFNGLLYPNKFHLKDKDTYDLSGLFKNSTYNNINNIWGNIYGKCGNINTVLSDAKYEYFRKNRINEGYMCPKISGIELKKLSLQDNYCWNQVRIVLEKSNIVDKYVLFDPVIGEELHIFNVHLPAKEVDKPVCQALRIHSIRNLIETEVDNDEKNVILGGDFNIDYYKDSCKDNLNFLRTGKLPQEIKKQLKRINIDIKDKNNICLYDPNELLYNYEKKHFTCGNHLVDYLFIKCF